MTNLNSTTDTTRLKESEFRRGALRMLGNYVRLFITVCIGLMLVRVILEGWGNDAWALIALLGGTLGIAAMLQDIVRQSMIRELGSALHSGDEDHFLSTYNSSLVITACVGVITCITIMIIVVILPLFKIPDELLEVARWLVVAKGIETVFAVLVGAPMNMYIATERMALSNLWIVVQRTCPIATAVWIIMVQGIEDPINGLKTYAVVSSSLFVAVTTVAVLLVMALDRRLIPRLGLVSKKAIKELLHIGGWNAVAVTSLGMHIRIDAILMNLFLGLGGNLIYGFTSQLTSYVRMLAMGVSYGLDAVTTRITSNEGDAVLKDLCFHITRLNSCIAMPAAAGLFILAEPILTIWVGDRMGDPTTELPMTATLIRVMSVGMVIRALTDGWIKILYGAGHVSKYAPLILGAVVANPILAIVLYFVLPESIRFTFAVSAYSAVYLIANLGLLPRLMGKLMGCGAISILTPMLRPLIVTAFSMMGLAFAVSQFEQWSLARLFGVSACYGMVYAVLVMFIVLRSEERRRVVQLLKRSVKR